MLTSIGLTAPTRKACDSACQCATSHPAKRSHDRRKPFNSRLKREASASGQVPEQIRGEQKSLPLLEPIIAPQIWGRAFHLANEAYPRENGEPRLSHASLRSIPTIAGPCLTKPKSRNRKPAAQTPASPRSEPETLWRQPKFSFSGALACTANQMKAAGARDLCAIPSPCELSSWAQSVRQVEWCSQ